MDAQTTQSDTPMQPLNIASIADLIRNEATKYSLTVVKTGNAGRAVVAIYDQGTRVLRYVIKRTCVIGPNRPDTGGESKAGVIVQNIEAGLAVLNLKYNPEREMYCR